MSTSLVETPRARGFWGWVRSSVRRRFTFQVFLASSVTMSAFFIVMLLLQRHLLNAVISYAPADVISGISMKLVSAMLLGIVLVVLIVTLLVWGMAQAIASPVEEVAKQLSSIAQHGGDLTQEVRVPSADEIWLLAEAYNASARSWRERVRRVAYTVGGLVSASNEVSRSVTETLHASQEVARIAGELLDGAQKQLQSVEWTYGGVRHMLSTIDGLIFGCRAPNSASRRHGGEC